MTRAELARRVGVSWQQIQKWERQESLQADRLLQIAAALDAPLSEFLGDQVKELEREAGLSEEERALVERLRDPGGLSTEQALELVSLDADGVAMLTAFLGLPPEGRREASREIRKLRIDYEGRG